MAKLSERIGKWDDRSVVYRVDDPHQRVAWRRVAWISIASCLIFAALTAIGRACEVEGAVSLLLGLGAVAFLVIYAIWRRRRNRRLTGSPTKWPTA